MSIVAGRVGWQRIHRVAFSFHSEMAECWKRSAQVLFLEAADAFGGSDGFLTPSTHSLRSPNDPSCVAPLKDSLIPSLPHAPPYGIVKL